MTKSIMRTSLEHLTACMLFSLNTLTTKDDKEDTNQYLLLTLNDYIYH